MALSLDVSRSSMGLHTGGMGLHKRFSDDAKRTKLSTQTIDSIPMLSIDAALSSVYHNSDIQWNPSYKSYLERVRRLSKLQLDRPTKVPPEFPTAVHAPWVWSGSDLKEEDFVVHLQETDIVEVESALASFKSKQF